jgi:hypothetical protein
MITETDFVVSAKSTWHSLHVNPVEPTNSVVAQLNHYGQNLAREAPVFVGDDSTGELFAAILAANWDRVAEIARASMPLFANGYKAIVRDGDRKLHQIASGSYSICQFNELAKLADTMLESGRYGLATCGTLKAGANMFISLNMGSAMIAGPDDKNQLFRNLVASHDSSNLVTLADSRIRIVCYNTYRAYLNGLESAFSIRHCGDMGEKIQHLAEMIQKADAAGETSIEQLKRMAQIDLTGDDLTSFLSDYWQENYLESVDSATTERVQKLREDRKLKAFEAIKARIEYEALKLNTNKSVFLALQAVNNWEANKTDRLKSRSMVEKNFGDSTKDSILFRNAYALVG